MADPFFSYFESQYAIRCVQVAEWLSNRFQGMSSEDLQAFIRSRVGQWGVEFTDEPLEDEATIQ